MRLQSLHTHSILDDGNDTLEQMLQSALVHGLDAIGFSGHSPIPGEDWTLRELPPYLEEVARLKRLYGEQLGVYCGLELDLRSEIPAEPFDYLIGSAHFVPVEGHWISVDESAATTRHSVTKLFHGDSDAYAKAYFAEVEKVAGLDCCQIAGHLDLLTKYNQRDPLLDEDSPVYRAAALRAAEALVAAGKIIEINTGAIGRGHRTLPYPALWLLRELCRMGAHVTVTADAHRADTIAGAYRQALDLAQAAGFRELWLLRGTSFIPCPMEELELL